MSLPTSKEHWREKILITVKTYPHPSKTYDELVCTAGIRENGSWVRLYPMRFRYLPYAQQYKKYDWIEIEVEKNDRKDPRPETLRPLRDGNGDEMMSVIGHIGTEECWLARKEILRRGFVTSMCDLINKCRSDGTSLGTIQPSSIDAFIVEKDDREWKPQWRALMEQQNLFGELRKPLAKIPYKFSYRFRCENTGCKGHKMLITDWEIHQLYLNSWQLSGSEEFTLKNVRYRYEQEFLQKQDLLFFVGTTLEHQQKKAPNPFLIVGIFYPPKEQNLALPFRDM